MKTSLELILVECGGRDNSFYPKTVSDGELASLHMLMFTVLAPKVSSITGNYFSMNFFSSAGLNLPASKYLQTKAFLQRKDL